MELGDPFIAEWLMRERVREFEREADARRLAALAKAGEAGWWERAWHRFECLRGFALIVAAGWAERFSQGLARRLEVQAGQLAARYCV
jgi:hypothetical protein